MIALAIMFELVTSYTPLLVAFVLGTLVPRMYESVLAVFFHMPDQFLNIVNTTLVPRFGHTGGKIVLVVSQTAVMIIKEVGKMLISVARHLYPLVLSIVRTFAKVNISGALIYLGSLIFSFTGAVWNEVTLFFAWTSSAFKTEFVRFTFHLLALYLSVHFLIWSLKRMLKKVV